MRNRSQKGFTLIELLIVIAIIGILAAVLIPNLLNARARAFDTAAQTCLKEIATLEEVYRSDFPFEYTAGTPDLRPGTDLDGNAINSCANVTVTAAAADLTVDDFTYEAFHTSGRSIYTVSAGTGVTRDRDRP